MTGHTIPTLPRKPGGTPDCGRRRRIVYVEAGGRLIGYVQTDGTCGHVWAVAPHEALGYVATWREAGDRLLRFAGLPPVGTAGTAGTGGGSMDGGEGRIGDNP